MKSLGRTDDFRALYDGTLSIHNMSWYIHSEFLPKICRLRREGKLTKGEKVILLDEIEFTYTGELDDEGQACGVGISTNGVQTITGTFEAD